MWRGCRHASTLPNKSPSLEFLDSKVVLVPLCEKSGANAYSVSLTRDDQLRTQIQTNLSSSNAGTFRAFELMWEQHLPDENGGKLSTWSKICTRICKTALEMATIRLCMTFLKVCCCSTGQKWTMDGRRSLFTVEITVCFTYIVHIPTDGSTCTVLCTKSRRAQS